ncbi:MAG: M28 family peptidase [Bacteroidales bacterium]|nr:M28 family peptidase [Bacteroidales bacterium]
MNKIRPIILALAVVMAGFLAYGFLTLPKAKPADAEGFSAERVVKDIEFLSKEHHSVAHPQERARVREYLVERLYGLGADTVRLYEYDSLVGPKNRHVVYTFDAKNILAEFAPENATDSTAYLMFVAHYDSRYSHPMPKRDTVWSYGAADDGYGVGVTLETVAQVLKQHSDWNQGVKVLFTDAEEVGMYGMTAQWENNREVFDNVGLMINIEARGPMGPALLFETSPGSEKVMDLYADAAKYHYTYSLTTVVYTFMPNFTDFTIVKDYIPGMNFSTITDVNHYHTDKDNFGNVNEKSIQHYGEQILPIAQEYVMNDKYADKDYFRTDKDTVNFTIPLLGLFNFSKTIYLVINVVIFFLFLLVFGIEKVRGRLKSAAGVLKVSAIIFGFAIGVLLLGEGIAYVCAAIAGAKFKLFGTVQGVQFDNAAMIVSAVLMTVVCVLVYLAGRKKAVRAASGSMRSSAATTAVSHYAYRNLYGALALVFILAVALLLALGENMMFFIPLAFTVIAMVLYHVTGLKFWIPVAIFAILLHMFSFYFALSMALTIGAFGAVMMLAFFDIMVLIPLADLYLISKKK